MILVLLGVLAASVQALESVSIREAECYTMTTQAGRVISTRIPGLHIIERTAQAGPFVLAGDQPDAINCPRSSIVPAPNDWKVTDAGFPLYITEMTEPPAGRRVGVLEVSQGQFRYRLVQGDLTSEESERVRARLNQLQEMSR